MRRVGDGEKFLEEAVVRIAHDELVDPAGIEKYLKAALRGLATTGGAKKTGSKDLKGRRRKPLSQ